MLLPCLQIRAATFSLVATAYKQLPGFVGAQAGLLCPLVLGSLGESDPVVVGPLWEAILLTVTSSEVLVAGGFAVEGVLKWRGFCSGTPLLWTPWGPGEVSCIERCPHFRNPSIVDILETW